MRKGRVPAVVPYRGYLLKRLADPAVAAAYLNAAARERDTAAFKIQRQRAAGRNNPGLSVCRVITAQPNPLGDAAYRNLNQRRGRMDALSIAAGGTIGGKTHLTAGMRQVLDDFQ